MQSLKEYFLGYKAFLCRIAVRSVMSDAVRNVELVVHLTQVLYKCGDLLIVGSRPIADTHVINYNAVTLLRGLILCVEGNNLRQVHCVSSAVDDM